MVSSSRCLAFYENDRVVRTASAQQVRKPIYDTAKQAWQGFEDYLEPLTESQYSNRAGEARFIRSEG